MKVTHLTWLLSNRGGGIPPVIGALARAQAAAGASVEVLGVEDPAERPQEGIPSPRVHPAAGPLALGRAPGLARALAAAPPELLHLHGLFTWTSKDACDFGRRTGRPVVVSPHGMLEAPALARSAWKKRVFRAFVEDDNLRRAACLHALNAEEARSFRAFGLTSPVAIVPNGVELPDIAGAPPRDALRRRFPSLSPGRLLLFLGRLHPKKGLHVLVDAWARLAKAGTLDREGWSLVVAGPDQLGHEAEVRRDAEARGLGGRVHFVGPLWGEAKAEAFAAADAFALPSYTEGFSIAVLEAMAWRLPVVITRACNFDVEAPGAGLLCEADAASVAAALETLLSRSPAERAALGAAGRALVERAYTWPSVAASLIAVYAWLLGGGARPASVEVMR
ncbi:MAG: glycosyltransferase [Anaeromyxobacteraceae bacterium]